MADNHRRNSLSRHTDLALVLRVPIGLFFHKIVLPALCLAFLAEAGFYEAESRRYDSYS